MTVTVFRKLRRRLILVKFDDHSFRCQITPLGPGRRDWNGRRQTPLMAVIFGIGPIKVKKLNRKAGQRNSRKLRRRFPVLSFRVIVAQIRDCMSGRFQKVVYFLNLILRQGHVAFLVMTLTFARPRQNLWFRLFLSGWGTVIRNLPRFPREWRKKRRFAGSTRGR